MMRSAVLATAFGTAAASPSLNENPIEKFAKWESAFEKTYGSKESRAMAFFEFMKNDAIIIEHNAKKLSYRLGHNKFSDQSWEQFAAGHLGYVDLNRAKVFDDTLDLSGPFAESLDWVSKGAVTKVKNQAQCGSCWSFSTTGSVEGALQIATNKLISLSEQQLVSCDTGSNGCHGGSMDQALQWIESNPLCTEDSYPYTSGGGQSGTCKRSCTGVATITQFVDVRGETDLMAAINKGPVSIAIEADKSPFQLYSGGILDNPGCGKRLDHGVLLVGYGTDGGKDYWKIKNSWGAGWGEEGYIRFVRGKDQCGLADQAVYPTGAKLVGPSPGPSPPGPPSPPSPPSPSSCSAGCQAACSQRFGGPCCQQKGVQCLCCRAGQKCNSFGGCSGGSDCSEVTLGTNGSSIVV